MLNWLDDAFTAVNAPKFECLVTGDGQDERSIEIRNLKVWLYQDPSLKWIAQGLDIGYAVSAGDIEEAKEKFVRGLALSIVVNLQKTGTIDSISRPAPPDVWLKWRRAVRHADAAGPKRVVSEEQDVVPGLQAPAPRLDVSFYGCPA